LSGVLAMGPDRESFDLSRGLNGGLSGALSFGLSGGLLYWILLGLFQGIESSRIEDQARHLPNQGIRHSLYNSIRLALLSSALIRVTGILSDWLRGQLRVVLSYGLPFWLNGIQHDVLIVYSRVLGIGLILAVCGGLLVGFSRSGLAVLRHYIIRFLLARSYTFPWHAPRFLEEATARILLRRIGGGYSFPHRLLLDYFADLPEQQP